MIKDELAFCQDQEYNASTSTDQSGSVQEIHTLNGKQTSCLPFRNSWPFGCEIHVQFDGETDQPNRVIPAETFNILVFLVSDC